MALAAHATVASAPVPDARACPQCDSRETYSLPRYSTPDWRVVSCARCGFVYLANPPAYERLVDEFAWEKSRTEEIGRRRKARPVLMRLDRATRWRIGLLRRRGRADLYATLFKPGNVLDVGCGGGTQIGTPFVPYGIEISRALYESAAALMEARGGKAVHGPAAEAIRTFPDHFFSGVVLSSVLEHEMQPKPLLREVARVLADDGAAFVRVPNFGSVNRVVNGGNWCGFRHPDHVNYFTLRSLMRMARDAGLKLRLLHPVRQPLDDNINGVLTHAGH
jgi:SAM-dependent methyltransferase